jgi:hypothetical protein
MKTLLFLAIVSSSLTTSALAAGGLAAKEALHRLGRERGAAWLDRIVQMNGEQGTDQPAGWHIVASDGKGGLREFFVTKKGIVSDGPVPAAVVPAVQGPVMAPQKVVYDSTNAFVRAEGVAKKAQIGYDSATYRLRSPGSGAAPVWHVQLNDAAGQKVGDVTVSAATGKVIQFVAFTPPPPAPPPSQSRVAFDRTKQAVNRGAASVGRGINRAGGWVRRTFGTEPSAPAAPPPPFQGAPPAR